jgi:hypothetical protein
MGDFAAIMPLASFTQSSQIVAYIPLTAFDIGVRGFPQKLQDGVFSCVVFLLAMCNSLVLAFNIVYSVYLGKIFFENN